MALTNEIITEQLREKDAQIERLQRALIAVSAVNQDLQKKAQSEAELKNSKSWKLTAPLRALAELLKRLRRGQAQPAPAGEPVSRDRVFCDLVGAARIDICCFEEERALAESLRGLLREEGILSDILTDFAPDGSGLPRLLIDPPSDCEISGCCILLNRTGSPEDPDRSGLLEQCYAILETREEKLPFYEHDQSLSRRVYYLAVEEETLPFWFLRFLLANDLISFDRFYERTRSFLNLSGDRICINMPESAERGEQFRSRNQYGFQTFPGVRHRIGWIGCALSYRYIARRAVESGLQRITICEDDVVFPADFAEKMAVITEYLERSPQWDVFSGVMSDVGNVEILRDEEYRGLRFLWVNRMISTVFDVFSEDALRLIAEWDPNRQDCWSQTIDRYLESRNMAVVTNLPFLVGHDEGEYSTIWGGANALYSDMIAASQRKLKRLAREGRKGRQA